MRKNIALNATMSFFIMLLWISLPSSLSAFSPTPPSQFSNNGVKIEQALKEIQKALVIAQSELKNIDAPPLEKVQLTLQTILTKSVDGEFKLLLWSFGKRWEKERAHQIVLTLKPPAPYAGLDVSSQEPLAEKLADAIVSAARGVQAARSGEPPLELDRLEVEFKFVVVTQTTTGLDFEILPISAGIKGDLKSKAVNIAKVVFSKQ